MLCRAFKALAYKRYQHVPIYLEWAPANIFAADAPKLQADFQAALPSGAAATAADGAAPAVVSTPAVALPDTEDAETSTIYVKNLAFATGQHIFNTTYLAVKSAHVFFWFVGCDLAWYHLNDNMLVHKVAKGS